MKKILISILLLTASTLIYSQSMDLNHKKIHIVDSTMGLGITPTSRLHVFGNGTSSNMFNLTNDKDGVKDSSVIIDAIGNVGIGKIPNSTTKLDINGSAHIDSNLSVDQNIALSGLLSEIRFNRGGNISAPGFLCKFTGMGITIDTAHYFAIHYNRVLSSDNDTTISLGNFHLNLDNYTGKVGIGTTTPTYRLDVFGNGGTDNLLKVSNDINSTYDSTFVIKSNGNVGIGNNRALHRLYVEGSGDCHNIYSEYSGSYSRSAIEGRALGSDGYGIRGLAGTIGAKAGSFENYAQGTSLEVIANNGIAINVKSGYVIVDSTRFHSLSTTLSDNEQYVFPTNLSWKGEIDVDSLGYTLFTAQIRCDANGTPYLEGVSWKRWSSKTYVEVGSTDGYLNITDAGSGMAIKNSLGYTIKATLHFRTKQ